MGYLVVYDIFMPTLQFPEQHQCLFDESKRYIVLYGGRGGLKSWSVARALLIRGMQKKLWVLCAREVMNSISDSVHFLLKSQIESLGFSDFYQVLDTEIRGKNGTTFIFAGLRTNINKIKSFEDIDVAWIEEAANVSKASYDVLVPTIRKEGSQVILTFNPEIEEDETYQRFIVSPPTNSIVVKTSWRDNPWMSKELLQEKNDMEKRDPVGYLNVWEGQCKAAVEGAIFTEQLQKAVEESRITMVPLNESVVVHTYWDIGKSDATAIWFAQYTGMQWRILRHYSNSQKDLEHYIDYIKALPYNYGTHYLPHDARQDRLGMVRSVEEQVRLALNDVEIVERIQHKINALEAAKAIFPFCWFDKDLCAEGLSDLRRYSYAVNPQSGKVSKDPKHDIYSNSADAFLCFAQAATPDISYAEVVPSGRGELGRLG